MAEEQKEVRRPLRGCARCGGTHTEVVYRPFARPVEGLDGFGPFTHWASCPTNGDPILMRFLERSDEG